MIESCYWREELKADIRWLRTKQKIKRWSVKQVVLYERKLMLVAFQVRSLLERPKVNGRVSMRKFTAVRYPKIGDKPFTVVGGEYPHEHFDSSSPETVELSTWAVCNQLIHYYFMSTHAPKGSIKYESIAVFSDHMRHKCLYEFNVDALIDLFSVYGEEESASYGCPFVWDEKDQDYVMVDRRPGDSGRRPPSKRKPPQSGD